MRRAAVILAAVVLGASLFGLGLMVGGDDEPTAHPTNTSGEVQALVWEASPGAGAAPRCDSDHPDGVGRWTCEVAYPPRKKLPFETCALLVTSGGAVEGRCTPTGRSVSGTIAR
jgi:hypothetical protein